jgi:HlyD family secretion protein
MTTPAHHRPRTLADTLTQLGVPAAGFALLAFAVWYVLDTRPLERKVAPPIPPATSPFADALAASGVVEATTENIAVGSPTAGVVVKVLVKVGDEVSPGTPLFRLDDREIRGLLAVRQAAVERARSELLRLESLPRQEEIPVLEARVAEARANLDRERDAFQRARETFARKVTTEQDLIERQEALEAAEASLARAMADLDLLRAGAWSYDRDVTRAELAEVEAEVSRIEIEIDRLTVRSLVDGRVLRVDVRPGEFVGTPPSEPLVILGDVERMHVRVDIDEYDIARFDETAEAYAMPRGNLQQRYPLEFVRIEPYVVPKKSLTGDNTERVDVRVLQVIYRFDPTGRPRLFVGQQVEVYIDAVDGAAAEADGGSQSGEGR